jgi:hypothetical protein
MTFTESDAANDGLIKREVGREMAKVAKSQNPQVFQHFENVCEEVGREPWEVFGEMAVRSLNNEAYAERVLQAEINMGQIKADEIRLEDVKYVKELSEELGLNQTEESQDPIDKLINQRLEMVTSSPWDNLSRDKRNTDSVNGEVLEHMEALQSEITRLQQKIEGEDAEVPSTNQTSESSGKSVDELFGGEESEEVEVETEESEPEPEPEVEEVEPQDVQTEEDEQIDEGPTEEEIEEAFEGTDSNVDDVWEDDDAEELDPEIEIGGEGKGGDPFVTSEDGEAE